MRAQLGEVRACMAKQLCIAVVARESAALKLERVSCARLRCSPLSP